MNTIKRLFILTLFLVLFFTLVVSLSFFAGQMPNSVNVIPKSYQSKIQLTFQAGYNQLLEAAADLLKVSGNRPSQPTLPAVSTPIETPLFQDTLSAVVETATPDVETEEIYINDNSPYPIPLPEKDSPYFSTIIKSMKPDPETALMIRRNEFIKSIEETERGATIDAALSSVLDSRQLDAIKAMQTDVFPPNFEVNYFIHLPALYLLYPRPEGYDEAIARNIQAVDIGRYESSTRNLVENYSPRHHNSYQVIINFENCVQSLTTFDKHNLLRALEDTQARFEALGYTVTQEPVADSAGSYNLVATKIPVRQDSSEDVIELGAHLDASWVEGEEITPGASDNAAGVAGLLEIAATLKNYPNRHPWRFMVFVEEENGKMGSLTHVQLIKNQPFKAALIMDGIGWSEASPEYMNCIYSNDSIPFTGEIAGVFDQVRQIYGIPTGWRTCSYASDFSDQGSYWKSGLPAVLSVGGLPYDNINLHKCSDNMTTLNLFNAYYAIQENLGVLLTLDKD
jgi:hypothetical protein